MGFAIGAIGATGGPMGRLTVGAGLSSLAIQVAMSIS